MRAPEPQKLQGAPAGTTTCLVRQQRHLVAVSGCVVRRTTACCKLIVNPASWIHPPASSDFLLVVPSVINKGAGERRPRLQNQYFELKIRPKNVLRSKKDHWKKCSFCETHQRVHIKIRLPCELFLRCIYEGTGFAALRPMLKVFAPRTNRREVVGFERTKALCSGGGGTSGGGGKLKAGLVYERKG